jgi:hypothetical protein
MSSCIALVALAGESAVRRQTPVDSDLENALSYRRQHPPSPSRPGESSGRSRLVQRKAAEPRSTAQVHGRESCIALPSGKGNGLRGRRTPRLPFRAPG